MVSSPSIPPAPEPPDPFRVASAQTGTSVTTGIMNAYLANAEEDRPDGSMRWLKIAEVAVPDPVYDKDGVQTGMQNRIIPRFRRIITLSPTAQIIYDQQQATSQELNSLALSLAQQVNTKTATPFDLDGLPARSALPSEPIIFNQAPVPDQLVRTIGLHDYAAERQGVVDAIESRLNYNINRDRSKKEVELSHKGIFPGSLAFEREMKVFNLASIDARLQAYVAGSTEHQRLIEIEATKARFANETQQLHLAQQTLIMEFPSNQNMKKFTALMQLAEFSNVTRQQAAQERVLVRTQTMNEIGTLIHGTRVDMPQFAQFRSQPINDTPVGQYVYQTAALKQQAWQTQANIAMQQAQTRSQLIGSVIGAVGTIAAGGLGGSSSFWSAGANNWGPA